MIEDGLIEWFIMREGQFDRLEPGEDGIYPRGFLIGTVERAVRGAGQYQTAAVRPVVDFSHLDVVLVVLDRPPGPGGAGAKPPAPAGRGGS